MYFNLDLYDISDNVPGFLHNFRLIDPISLKQDQVLYLSQLIPQGEQIEEIDSFIDR